MILLFRACLLFISTIILCSGCVTNPYQEPPSSAQNTAIIKTDNESLVQGLFLNAMIFKPTNEIRIISLDGKNVDSISNEIRITPGNHNLIVKCISNALGFGEKTFNFTAAPGRTYIVSYPSQMNMHGYTVDDTACQKLILK